MQRTHENRSGAIVAWVVVAVAVLVLAGCTFAVLRFLTALPVWVDVVISLPAGMVFFYWFVKTHETNGFDGSLAAGERKSDDGSDAA
jgi:uncharacterized protein (DUF983 family)